MAPCSIWGGETKACSPGSSPTDRGDLRIPAFLQRDGGKKETTVASSMFLFIKIDIELNKTTYDEKGDRSGKEKYTFKVSVKMAKCGRQLGRENRKNGP